MPGGRPKVDVAGLLQAGLDLIGQDGLAALTVDAVVERAGTGKGTFYRHFGDRGGFLVAVHTELRERVWSAARGAIEGRAPGADRLGRAVTAYLDACLENRALKSFITEARADARVARAVEDDLAAGADIVAADLAVIGWADPAPVSRLFMAMAHETALTECRLAAVDHRLRASLLEIATRRTTG